jgi:4-hydroxy-tetrahydrodipicolinate synthase
VSTVMLTGCGTALVTPFDRFGSVDETALRSLVDWQIDEGIDFLVPCGSTGEAATLDAEEHRPVEQARGRVPIVAGAGSNDTRRAIATSQAMRSVGATFLLHVTPMYNKPPQRGLLAHFRAIAESVDVPIILYNVPGRTGVNLDAATTLELAHVDGIAGIKEASGDLSQITEILRHRPAGFSVLSGDDALTLAIVAAGGDGVISVVSNATPRRMRALVAAARSGNLAEARNEHLALTPWMRAAFIEANPLPAKAALHLMGKMGPDHRLPLVPLAPRHLGTVRDSLVAAGTVLAEPSSRT